MALARAIVIRPRVLLFDEPLSNLDAKLRVSMRGEIRHLQQTLKITTVYVTHDQEEAMAISDRIAVMEAGKIAQLDTAETFTGVRPRLSLPASSAAPICCMPRCVALRMASRLSMSAARCLRCRLKACPLRAVL